MGYDYNFCAQYEIIGRVLNGTSVISYILKDRRSLKNESVNKDIVEQLALSKQIYNCRAQTYKNIVNLKGIGCKLSKLPRYDKDCNLIEETDKIIKKQNPDLQIIGKMLEGRIITNYVIISVDDKSNKMVVPKDTVIQLAKDGRIINAKVQMNNGDLMLRGISGDNLAKLATYHY